MAKNNDKLPILLVIFLLLMSGLLFFISFGTIFGVFDPESPPMQNFTDGMLFFLFGLLFLYVAFEKPLKKKFSKKRRGTQRYQPPLIERLSSDPKKQKVIFSSLVLLFIGFIATPIIWSVRPTYEYSNNALFLMWLGIFPLLALDIRAVIKRQYKEIFKFSRFFISLCFVGYLLFYISIAQHYLNTQEIEQKVTIVSARTNNDNDYCWFSISVKDPENYRKDICADNMNNHNLVEGNIPYIDNGNATISLSQGWLGSVVDSIIWKPQYNSDDRRWSVDKQKYIYRNKQ